MKFSAGSLTMILLFIVVATNAEFAPAKPHAGGGYHEPHYGGYNDHPAYYQYGYKVNDDYHKTNFGANEKRDGKYTSGSYYVHLPDGRIQTVTYTVDGYNGYVADVKYEGKAYYPAHQPSYQPKPVYHEPAVVHKPIVHSGYH